MAPRVKITGEYGYQKSKKSYMHLIRGGVGFAFVVLGTSIVTTQYMARSLNYAAVLGEPYIIFGHPFYPPVKAWLWVYQLLVSGSRSRYVDLGCVSVAGAFLRDGDSGVFFFRRLARDIGQRTRIGAVGKRRRPH